MSAKKGFSKKELADQNAKVAELAKEEGKLLAAIDRGEKKLAEDREKLKETQRARASENGVLEQMIQKGIKAAARGESDQRQALIAALLMGADGDGEGEGQQPPARTEPDTGRKQTPAPTPTPTPAPAPSAAAPDASDSLPSTGADDQNEAA